MRKRFVVWMNFHGKLKVGMMALILVLMAFMLSYELPSTRTWSYWTLPLSGRTIVLDAGHGGPDGGASSKSGVIEKDVNLAIALYLRDYLQQAGAVVVLTRDEDEDLADPGTKGYSKRKTEDLLRRADFVAESNANLLISIHLNSIPSERWSGAQTFYSSSHPDNANLASLIQHEIKHNLANTDREPKLLDSKYLLRAVKVPSTLVEVGFLSNPEEARLMAQPSYQQKVAASIYQGVLRYYSGEKAVKSGG